jgi:hypothetical protein
MNHFTNSFPRPDTFARLSLLIAVLTLPVIVTCAQTRGDSAAFRKTSLKTTKPCNIPADGEVTALVKNGVELSVTEDLDCDGIPDAYDNCVGIPNRDQADTDHNGIGDACESAASVKAPAPPKSRAINKTSRATETAKSRSDKKTKDRKAIAADKRSNARTKRKR